jgi:hypothetical protein
MRRDLGVALIGFVALDYGIVQGLESVLGSDPGLAPILALVVGAWAFLSSTDSDN